MGTPMARRSRTVVHVTGEPDLSKREGLSRRPCGLQRPVEGEWSVDGVAGVRAEYAEESGQVGELGG
jgi:hypothetical protein